MITPQLRTAAEAKAWRQSRLEEIWSAEIRIDEKLSRTPTWSDRWWYLLGQLNICRRDRIQLRGVPMPGHDPFARAT